MANWKVLSNKEKFKCLNRKLGEAIKLTPGSQTIQYTLRKGFLNYMAWQQRDDNVPGTVYLLKAKNFHGWLPGCYLSRMKIGLTRNLEARLDTLHSAQPCTDLEEVHSVHVEDMAEVETYLHQVFKNQNVKLIKSREYFDLDPLQIRRCIWLMNRAKARRWSQAEIPVKTVLGGLVALLGVGMLIGHSFQPEPINQTIIEKSVKHR
jgi:plasmid maintenance system killer protein